MRCARWQGNPRRRREISGEVKTNFPLQDAYLLAIKRENAPVTIYLRNGFQLRGHVRGFDNFTIILEYDNKPHLVYKHAVSTVSPQTPVQFSSVDLANSGNSATAGSSANSRPSDAVPAPNADGAAHPSGS
jgi:host factor-I protein